MVKKLSGYRSKYSERYPEKWTDIWKIPKGEKKMGMTFGKFRRVGWGFLGKKGVVGWENSWKVGKWERMGRVQSPPVP